MTPTRPTVLGLAAVLVATLSPAAPAGSPPSIPGFSPARAARQLEAEAAFAALLSSERTRAWHRHFTAEPHPAGSKRNNELARYVAGEWRKQGLEDVVVHRYDVLNTEPREVSLTMVAPLRYEASLREEPLDTDPDTRNPRVSPGYLGLSASADVEAPVVYAHSGNPEDYTVLRRNGIDVRGKIVLVRYSNPYSYRGFKALTAEREGAAGILIYSDPAEDGFARGPVFPDGPWGPESHIQRGAITYDFIVPGDPLTPGWPSVPGAHQLKPQEARSLPTIAGLPLSWKDAKPLLENMDGPVAPKDWQGGLPFEYRLGGERVRVRMKVAMHNHVAPNYVVEGRIRGSELPDEWIVLGNHRDAWVFGGVDPSSGSASLMEVTRALGERLRAGARPRRTLVFCSWDGEEVGLTGSTEWGEQFADELKAKAVAYLNVDSSASGPDFEPQAVGSLAPLVVGVARELQDPATGRPLAEARRAAVARARAESGDEAPVTDDDLVDVRIGSGSDHTVFLNHLGVPTIGLSFDGPYGVYHSMFDGFLWMNRVGDPGYRYHVLLSRIWGTLALRLANADLLPFDFAAYARHLRAFVDDLEKSPEKGRLDLSRLRKAVDDFETAGGRLGSAVASSLASGAPPADIARHVNQGSLEVERNWLDPDGLPGRPWFQHTLYAARYTYAHLELPGLTEAVEEGDWDRAARQAAVLERAVARNAALVNSLAGELAAPAPASTTTLDADGTARITRVVPVPTTVSPEAQAFLATGASWAPAAGSEAQRLLIEKARSLYPVRIEDAVIGGVPVRVVTPPAVPPEKADRVLVNLHGGGFVTDSGSMLESIPIASLTRTKVVTVLYRLAPAHRFPAAVDDAIAVWRELLKTNRPHRMALYGTSAGAILSAESAIRMRREGLPLPAAVGFFTGLADFANPGDSLAFFGVPGLDGARPPDRTRSHDSAYLGDHDPKDPLVSPIYADLAGFPATLCVTGTRDLLLSGTVNFHRALLRKDVDARLVVFDAMPHAHWYTVGIPEATEALELMARFFDEQLGRPR